MSDTKINIEEYKNEYRKKSKENYIPKNHIDYLKKLKNDGFEPKVIYDIGSCFLHWTKIAKSLWPNSIIICFEAFDALEFLYKEENVKYFIDILSDEDNKEIKFYVNYEKNTGNSYYKENNNFVYPEDNFQTKKTRKLDSIVKEHNLPLPDFIKIDVQGSEIDVLNGSLNTIKNAKRMVIELQSDNYNLNAPKVDTSLPYIERLGWKCCDPLFQNNGSDGDYGFINIEHL